jgi:hypothetical protein
MYKQGIKYDSRIYLQWEKDYKKNPVKTRERLRKINKYHKQFLYILSLTRHKSLINDIYNIIIDKFRTDIHKHNNDKRISTLAKWLPREKSSFDRQLDFLKNFTDKLYPGMAKSAAYKLYRNHIVTLSKKLNITETLISTKKFDEIVFENVPTVCLRRNMKTFLKHEETREKLYKFLNEKFINVSSKVYVEYLQNNSLHPVEKQICMAAWSVRKNNYFKKNKFLHCMENRFTVPVIDTSDDMFNSELIYDNILVSLIPLQYANKIIINDKEPLILNIHYKENIAEKIQIIMRNMNNCQNINLEQLEKLTSSTVLVLSNKPTIGKCKNKVFYYPRRIDKVTKVKYKLKKLIKKFYTYNYANSYNYIIYAILIAIYTIFVMFIMKIT